jgi:hypothetical protein
MNEAPRTLSGPWGQDEHESVVAIVLDASSERDRRWWPVPRELAAAINAGKIASFNLFLSLDPEARALMASLYGEHAE